jgi:hypothetical protein
MIDLFRAVDIFAFKQNTVSEHITRVFEEGELSDAGAFIVKYD